MAEPPTRYVPQFPFPAFSYVPGKTPLAHASGGNGFGHEALPPYDPTTPWMDADVFWFGVDLFNHGYYWEAHEAWESLWHALGRRGLEADFIKGLIKLAAAGVKAREGRSAGVIAHAQRAAHLFGLTLAGKPTPWGKRFPTQRLVDFAHSIASSTPPVIESADAVVVAIYGRLPIY